MKIDSQVVMKVYRALSSKNIDNLHQGDEYVVLAVQGTVANQTTIRLDVFRPIREADIDFQINLDVPFSFS